MKHIFVKCITEYPTYSIWNSSGHLIGYSNQLGLIQFDEMGRQLSNWKHVEYELKQE